MSEAWRRIVVTLGVLAVLQALRHIRLPGLDDAIAATMPSTWFSIVLLGAMTWYTAHLYVEFGALTRAKWRRWRVGAPEDRARLWRATAWAWLVCVCAQGFAIAVSLEQMGDEWGPLVREPGVAFRLLTVATLAGGSALVGMGAGVIDRWGFGQGFAVLLLAAAVEATWTGFPFAELTSEEHRAAVLPVVCVLAGVPYAVWKLAPRRVDPGIPLLSAGTVAAGWAGVVAPLLMLLDRASTPLVEGLLALAVCAPAAPLAATLFHLPRNVAPVLGCTEQEARAALQRTLVLSVLVTVALVAVPRLPWFGPVVFDLVGLAALSAYAFDLYDEWRARAELDHPVVAWELHRVYAVGPALAALDAAGIPARVRGLHVRALAHFFAPHVPIQVLVPRARAADATDVLRAVTSRPPEVLGSRGATGGSVSGA